MATQTTQPSSPSWLDSILNSGATLLGGIVNKGSNKTPTTGTKSSSETLLIIGGLVAAMFIGFMLMKSK